MIKHVTFKMVRPPCFSFVCVAFRKGNIQSEVGPFTYINEDSREKLIALFINLMLRIQ